MSQQSQDRPAVKPIAAPWAKGGLGRAEQVLVDLKESNSHARPGTMLAAATKPDNLTVVTILCWEQESLAGRGTRLGARGFSKANDV